MVIEEEVLKEIIATQPSGNIEKSTTLSNDGKNLSTRIPKDIIEFFKLKRKDKLKWIVDVKTKEVRLVVINVQST